MRVDTIAERIPMFRNLILSYDKSLPKGKQWIAKLILWDHDRKIGTSYISWRRIAGTAFLIEGHETATEAIETVINKWEQGSADKETEFAE